MAVEEEDVEDIFDSLRRARASHDNEAIRTALQDLIDTGRKPTIYFRMVAINGDRVRYHVNLETDHLVIDDVNGIRNHVLSAKYKVIFASAACARKPWKYVKHRNDMSPEEYKWCILEIAEEAPTY